MLTPKQYKTLQDFLWNQADRYGLSGLDPDQIGYALTKIHPQVRSIVPSTRHSLLLLMASIYENLPVYTRAPSVQLPDLLFDQIMVFLDEADGRKPTLKRIWADMPLGFLPSIWTEFRRQTTILFHRAVHPPFDQNPPFDRDKGQNRGVQGLSPQESSFFTYPYPIQIFLLQRLLAQVFMAWFQDNTPDQSVTMSVLDRRLKELF